MKALLSLLLLLPAFARAEVWTVTGNPPALVAFDEGTGAVTRTLPLGSPPVGNVGLAVDSEVAYIVGPGEVRRVRLADGVELDPYFTPCCLLGVLLLDESNLYVLGEEFGPFLATIDKATGILRSTVTLPEDALAVAAIQQQHEPTAAPIVTPTASANGGGAGCHIQQSRHSAWWLLAPLVFLAVRRRRILGLALLVLPPPAGATYSPWQELFPESLTYSIDDGAPQPLRFATGMAKPALRYTGPIGSGAGECEAEGEAQGECVLIEPVEVPPWDQVYLFNLGIEVDDTWQDFTMPNGTSGERPVTQADLLRHVRELMTTVHAVYLRDVGLSISVRHVRIRTTPFTYDQQVLAWWHDHLPPVNAVLRLRPMDFPLGGGAAQSYCGQGGGWAPITLLANPATHDDLWARNVHLVGHELSHVFGLHHSDFYRGWDGQRVEECSAGCRPLGSPACPVPEDQSWAGYCARWCHNHGEALRVHYPGGELIDHMRARLLANEACLVPHIGREPGPHGDADNDEFPDDLDNCPNVPNPGQEDTDEDHFGNLCDGCQLSRSASARNLLGFLPVVGVLVAKRVKA